MGAANSLNITQSGLQSFDSSNGVFAGRTITAGAGITITNGNGVSGNPTISLTGDGVALEHLTGNSGGALNPDGSNNINILTANSTVKFVGSGSTLTEDFFAVANLGLGDSLANITSGGSNICTGFLCGTHLKSASGNSGYGYNSLNVATTSGFNVSVGLSSLQLLATGSGFNTSVGTNSLLNLLTGTQNVSLGYASGSAYAGAESSNILIKNAGTGGESNTIRIGTQGSSAGQQSTCFIAGIAGVSTSNNTIVTQDSSTGQLGATSTVTVENGGTGRATLTNHGVLVGATTSAITQLAAGSAGQVLQSGGASADPAYSTATYPSTSSTNGNILSSDGTNFVSSPILMGIYADGSDGAQTFDGSTVILGITPSSSTYTLARDIFLLSGVINNGVTIITNGYRIFCLGNLTNNGTIHWNGNNASGATLGAALNNGTSTINAVGNSPGTAGRTATTIAGLAGVSTDSTLNNYGGQGGSGGTGGIGAGGAGGTRTTNPVKNSSIRFIPFAIFGFTIDGTTTGRLSQGGTGGGAGSGDGVNTGGGGGGGAGIVIVISLTISGTGTIRAKGGAGGNATVGNCGGGGGGGGGLVIVISRSVSSGAISGQTIDVSGGSAGSSIGTGGAAGAGNIGTSVLLSF